MKRPVMERFWEKVDKSGGSDACWIWTASCTGTGYGTFRVGEGFVTAHRFLYEREVGPVRDGLELDHICHSFDPNCPGGHCSHRTCVNPAHLEQVTHAENMRRSRNFGRRKTHCKNGHEFTDENTLVTQGRRKCRECHRASGRRFKARKKEAAVA